MEKTNMFSKKLGLLFFTCVFFLTLGTLSIVDANASQVSNYDEIAVIGESTPTNIQGDFEIAFPKPNKVTNPVNKTSSKVNVVSQNKVCYIHVLEQGGSPTAKTVKVCE